MNRSLCLLISSTLFTTLGCFEDTMDVADSGASTESGSTGDGDGDTGDGDGDSGDGDGDSGDGDGDTGDGDGDTGDGDGDTGPMCEPGETDCGGLCVVLDDDPAHCGACDHDCLGGTCSAGTCEPIELASGKGRLFMVHVDQNNIYYGGDGVDVSRMAKDGSNDTVLVPAGGMIDQREWCYDSAITPDTVVWGNDWVQPGVRGCTKPACMGGPQTFKPGLNLYAMTFNQDNGKLYWNQGADVVEALWPAGAVNNFAPNQDSPRELTNDGEFVYWASRVAIDDYHVRKLSAGGGNVVELAINRPSVTALAVGPSKIYWAEQDAIVEAALPNGIGGANPPVFADVGGIRKMTTDDTHVYWTSNQDGVGTVGRCPLDGCDGPPELLAQVAQPWGITLDAVAVYFVTEAGFVLKVAK